jgi:GTPase Era involved in 16S rRNA processing
MFVLVEDMHNEDKYSKEKVHSKNRKEYRKSLEIESQNIVSPNSKKLISDIAFFIDLENDFDHDRYRKDLHKLLHDAYDLMIQDIEIHKGSMGVNLAVIGNFSSGKSSFINSLIGRELCPVKVNPTTSSITRFIYSDKPKIMLVNEDKEISSEEYMDLVQHSNIDKMDKTKSYQIDYYYPFEEMRDITIYDTPGFNNPKNTQDEKVTMEHATEADVIFLVMDINNGDLDNSLLDKIKVIQKNNDSTKWHLIVNKSDLKPPANREKVLLDLQNKYADKFETIIAYSSKNSNSKVNFDQQLEKIYKTIKEQLEEAMAKKVPDVNLYLNMKKNENSKTYDCYIGDNRIGELQAEKDVDKLKKKQKEEVLSILTDIGSNKYHFLTNKFDTELSLYENSVKKIIRNIQTDMQSKKKNYISDFELKLELAKVSEKLKNKRILNELFMQIINNAKVVKVSEEEKFFWNSPYWKWKFNDNINVELFSINNVSLFVERDLFLEKYNINMDNHYLNFHLDKFLRDKLWDRIIYLLKTKDTEYFDEKNDANKYKKTFKQDFDIRKELNYIYQDFCTAINRDIESLRLLILDSNKLDNETDLEIVKKINIYLGEENVR